MTTQRTTAGYWKPAVQLALAFAAIKFAIEFVGNLLAQHFGYGIFRDEMYYVVCGRHLAWGYVDQAPMVALQARIAELLFGFHHLALFRSLSAVAGAAKVFLTGVLAWQLGGRRIAQVMAMIAVLIAPVYLGIDSFLSMNSFEPVFWMGCMVVVLLMGAGGSPKWWVLFGILGGLGLLNKPSMAFFLVALLIGLLLTPQRRILWSRWTLAAIGLIVLISLPYLLWQIHHQWPTLVWLNNVNHSNKNVKLGPGAFIGAQIMMLHPISIFLLLPGLVWLFIAKSARGFRWIGLMYVVLLAIMIHLFAKDYYVAPVYPVLFAAGALAWQNLFSGSRKTAWLLPAWCVVMIILGAITLPMAIPVMPPYTWIRYTKALHLVSQNTETAKTGPLPQFYADRFGWHGLVAEVARIYNSLTPADRTKAGIFCSNYGEAAAVDLFGPKYGLPSTISGHQNYYFWGPREYTGALLIVVGETKSDLEKYCGSVKQVGTVDNPLAMPYENGPIYLCRGGEVPLSAYWPNVKTWY
ncbi:MAG TPA: glycosyltransferase family 39 protein [Acidobacteriaceae bacterium]|nr:glycosyltransferase family 39 protein [Acidobacteriaceae bacterium]